VKLTLSNSGDTGGIPDPLSDSRANRRAKSALLFAAGAAVYWALATLIPYFSGTNLVRLSPFFVGAAGYFLGFRAGVAASLAAATVHTVTLNRLGMDGMFVIFRVEPLAHVGILLLGPLAGEMRSRIGRLQADVARRKEDELELRETLQRLHEAIGGVEEAIWFCSPDRNRMVYMSPAFEKVVGVSRAEAEADPRSILAVVNEEDRADFEQVLESPPQGTARVDYRVERADGSTGWIQTRLFCVRNDDGSIQRIAGVSRDVTERKEAVLALEAAQDKNRELVEKLAAADLAREAVGSRRKEPGRDRAPSPRGQAKEGGGSAGPGTVLVAMDERSVLRLTRQVLQQTGRRIRTAHDGEAALDEASRCDHIDMLIADVVLPGMNGRELATELRRSHPQLKVLFISGYIGKASVSIAELGPNTSFLSKPFSPEALARKIRLLSEDGAHTPPSPTRDPSSHVSGSL
jgi:PAS domain S-box-containing protein